MSRPQSSGFPRIKLHVVCIKLGLSYAIVKGFLKANYSWKMENDKFFEFKNLASEVDISRNSIKITEIKFE